MDTAAHATVRFGLGHAAGQPLPGDPRRWLVDQLANPDPAPSTGATVADALLAHRQDRLDRPAGGEQARGEPTRARTLFLSEQAALLNQALLTPAPFRERLVHFWANHFTVSLRAGQIAPMIGAYVRDAIRPHVTGRFGDMLLAVVRHPAMLIYLNNAMSAGPGSPAGQRTGRGLNENLARECLELHTLGPAGTPAAGYTQADVTEFARILTGWSVEREQEPLGFRFRPNLHEPGAKTLLGQQVPEGEEGGVAALAFLAAHPATHHALAVKLVRHFTADTPPPDAVRRIEGVLRDTGGDLGAASLALVELPAAWQPLTKLRPPQDFVIAALRASGLPEGHRPDPAGIMAALGQPFFNAPSPIGWPDAAADWAGPEELLRRVDWAYGFAGRAELPDPETLAATALGPLLSPATANEMRHAGSRRDALTLLLASPEFQRR